MTQQSKREINRQGLDQDFESEEACKSNLILTAQLMREQQKQGESAAGFAQTASSPIRVNRFFK
jgi:hypothetical protein